MVEQVQTSIPPLNVLNNPQATLQWDPACKSSTFFKPTIGKYGQYSRSKTKKYASLTRPYDLKPLDTNHHNRNHHHYHYRHHHQHHPHVLPQQKRFGYPTQETETPRSSVPLSPTTPYRKGQGTIENVPVPPPPPPAPVQQNQQSPKREIEKGIVSETAAEEEKSEDNEIKSLEECESVPLDVVSRDFPWDKCAGYATSSNPEASVFFIQVPNEEEVDSVDTAFSPSSECIPQVLVVKASLTLVQELFGMFLADWFLIQTPQVQLIEKFPRDYFMTTDLVESSDSDSENNKEVPQERKVGYHWKEIRDTLKRMASEDENFGLDIKIDKDLGSSMFLLLMEFMSGAQSLDSMEEDMLTDPACCSSWLRGMGRLVVVDIILNNWDRIPAIWDNHGNAGNVLIGSADDQVYAIDQALTSIQEESDQELYLDKVKDFVSDFCSVKGKTDTKGIDSSKYLESILAFVKNPFKSEDFEGIERSIGLSDHDAKVAIWKGINDSIQRAQSLSLTRLENIKSRVNQMKTGNDNETANEYWNHSIESSIDISFVYKVVEQFQQPFKCNNNKNNN